MKLACFVKIPFKVLGVSLLIADRLENNLLLRL